MTYVNYHTHSQYSNLVTPDVAITNRDRINRSVELGHNVAGGIEHGITGNVFEFYDICKEKGIKPLLGTEAYFVKDRIIDDGRETKDKDRTNAHIVLLAKNENGRKAINRILSEANRTGFYHKARVDFELLETLPENDVWVTTACIGGIWKYEDAEDIVVWLQRKFKDNFFLEVQCHHTMKQQTINEKILILAEEYSIAIIAGMDSHYINAKDAEKRDIFLASRGINYEDEFGWFLNFPSRKTAVDRFRNQGILTDEQIETALDNTLIFEQVEEYTSPIFDKTKIKLPTIYPNKTQEEKNEIFKKLIRNLWKEERDGVPKDKQEKYTKEIIFELNTVIDTGMADYFLLNYEIIKEAKKNGGQLTLTGRGSAASFYLSKLLGFTTIDRIKSPVKLFPERFMSKERILLTHSLPDVDFNCGNPKVFEEAQTKVMGAGHSARMITFQKSAVSRAWKDYARYSKMDFDEANLVSVKIREYEKALTYADTDEEKEAISVYDYLDYKYKDDYEASGEFIGMIQSLGSHPCAFLLMDFGRLDEEIGLMRTRGGELCVAIDGKTADKRLFLKNDILKVTVVEAIYNTFDRIGIPPIPADKLMEMCTGDEKTWGMYAKGITMGLNQVETESTSKKVSAYKPKNVSELSSFVAAIRPGFKSNYGKYSRREPFSYDVPAIDSLIQTEEFPYSYMLYQENSMSVLGYAGIPLSETNQVVKDIAKKNHAEVYKYESIFKPLLKEKLVKEESITEDESERVANMTWKIVEDSAFYQFNACVSGDTHIQKAGGRNRFDPSIEEMFLIMNDREYARKTGHLPLNSKYKYNGYGNALSMNEDGRVRKNKIVNIFFSGNRNVYEVKTKGGAKITCTMNHKFPTPSGKRTLSNLRVGDTLFISRTKVFEKGIPTLKEKIVSISFVSKQNVYDVEMKAPSHNFISSSGLVTSNSHSVCVGTDSLYSAWQKAHYPLEMYEAYLRIYDRDSKKDKILKMKSEAEKHFNISFPSFGWGQDNRNILLDRKSNSITMSLSTIKGFGSKVADSFWELHKTFDRETFLDLVIFASENKMFSKSKWESLVKINYFAPFGIGSKKLEKFLFEITSGKMRYSPKHKDKTKEKRIEGLKQIFDEMPEERYSYLELIENEISILGQVNTRFKKIHPYIVIVTGIDHSNPKYSPKINLYSLANGTSIQVKANKNFWKKNKLEERDIIVVFEMDKKEKSFPTGEKTDNGKPIFEKLEGTEEFWLTDFRRIGFNLEDLVGIGKNSTTWKSEITNKILKNRSRKDG